MVDNRLTSTGAARLGGDDLQELAGSWSCRDATAAAVDCGTGPGSYGAFTRAAPMLPGTDDTATFTRPAGCGSGTSGGQPIQTT